MLLHYDDKEQLSARAVVIPKGSRQERLPRYFTDEESIRIIQPLSERDQLIVLWAAVYRSATARDRRSDSFAVTLSRRNPCPACGPSLAGRFKR